MLFFLQLLYQKRLGRVNINFTHNNKNYELLNMFIQRQIKEGKAEIAWSSTLDFEIKRSPYQSRREASDIFRRLSRVIVDIDDDVRRASLDFQARGLALVDSLHVASAIKAKCDYFITVDKRILNKAITEIEVWSPIQFVQFHENDF